MPTLTITAKGQVTLRKELLKHLGAAPGDKVFVQQLSDGRIEVRAARKPGKISDAFGCLRQENGPSLTIEEIAEILVAGLGAEALRIAVDTNVLVRVLTEDDPRQAAIARAEFERAEIVTIATPALCELVWVLSRGYRLSPASVAGAIRRLIAADKVVVDRSAVDAGLAQLDAGGDFADGVIARDGRRLGASTFVSFDRKAVHCLASRGEAARLL